MAREGCAHRRRRRRLALVGTGATLAYNEEGPSPRASTRSTRRPWWIIGTGVVFDRLWYHDPITNELKSRLVERSRSPQGARG